MLKPLGDRLLVRRKPPITKTEGGIEIPQSAQEATLEAMVLAIGEHVTGLNPNDRVLIGKYAGTEVKIDGGEVVILREDEVIGRLEE